MAKLTIVALVDNTNGADELREVLAAQVPHGGRGEPILSTNITRENSRTLRYTFCLSGPEPAIREALVIFNSDVLPLWVEHPLFIDCRVETTPA